MLQVCVVRATLDAACVCLPHGHSVGCSTDKHTIMVMATHISTDRTTRHSRQAQTALFASHVLVWLIRMKVCYWGICWRPLQGLDWSLSSCVSSSWTLASSFVWVCMCAHGHPHTVWISSWPGLETHPIQLWLVQIGHNLDPQVPAFSRCLTPSTWLPGTQTAHWLACLDARWQIHKDFVQLLTLL